MKTSRFKTEIFFRFALNNVTRFFVRKSTLFSDLQLHNCQSKQAVLSTADEREAFQVAAQCTRFGESIVTITGIGKYPMF